MRKLDSARPILKATLLFTSTLIVMAAATIAPALPLIQARFADEANVAFWVRLVLTLPALFIAGTAPIAGYLVDRIGRKKVLVISTLLYGVSGAAGYFAPTLNLLLASRALLGISVGGLMTSVTTLIADYYTGEARSHFMGLQAGFMGLGGTAFLVLGGMLAEIGWRVPFLIYFSAFAILPMILLVLYEPLPAEKCVEKQNPISDAGVCVAESMRPVEGDGAAGSTTGAAFPIRIAVLVYALMFGMQVIFYFMPVQLPFYLQGLTGATASQSGLALSVLTFFYAMASIQYGRVAARFDRFGVLTLAFALIGAGYLLISIASGWTVIVLGLLLGGVGLGLMVPNLNVWLANESPPELRGRVLGGLTTAMFLGQFLSPFVGQPVSTVVGMGGAFLSAAVLVLLMVPVSMVTRRQLRTMTG
jgi:MFS family permease